MQHVQISKEDTIRAKAHALWIEEGRPDGRAEQHWLRAVELVDAEVTPVPAVAPKRKAAPRKRA